MSKATRAISSHGEGGGWGRVPFSKKIMSPTPRRKWYLTTGRRAHSMVLDPIPQSLPVHFFGSRPQPPTSPLMLTFPHSFLLCLSRLVFCSLTRSQCMCVCLLSAPSCTLTVCVYVSSTCLSLASRVCLSHVVGAQFAISFFLPFALFSLLPFASSSLFLFALSSLPATS